MPLPSPHLLALTVDCSLPGQVTFENKKGEMHLIGVEELKKLFVAGNAAGGPSTKLVFVSACHSESVGSAFAEAGVPHVVAVSSKEEMLDLASQEFAQAFYTALFAGKTVKAAFEIGQAAVKVNGDIPLVYRNEAVRVDYTNSASKVVNMNMICISLVEVSVAWTRNSRRTYL